MVKILVNIPALNEEKTIGNVISEIPKKILGANVDILVVNDGSKDNTVKVSKKAGAKFIITHEYNKGVGEAFKSACQLLIKENYDILVNIDADGQFNPKDIEKLVTPILKHKSDIVLASRFSGHKANGIPFIKDKLNRIISFTIGSLLRHKIDDLTCGFRAYSKETILKLNLIEPFTYTQETIVSAIGKKLRLKWIPINVRYFDDRESRVVSSIRSYINKSVMILLRTVRDTNPLLFFGIPSMILIVMGIASGLIFTFFYLLTFQTTPYRTFFFLCIFFLIIGFQMLLFALMADMIKSHRKLTEENMYLSKKVLYKEK